MILIEDKIIKRQIKYYKYVIDCIDKYLTEKNKLLNFLDNLILLKKTCVVFDEHFDVLYNAVKTDDIIVLLYFRYKFSCFIQKNEIS